MERKTRWICINVLKEWSKAQSDEIESGIIEGKTGFISSDYQF